MKLNLSDGIQESVINTNFMMAVMKEILETMMKFR